MKNIKIVFILLLSSATIMLSAHNPALNNEVENNHDTLFQTSTNEVEKTGASNIWGEIEYKGKPWVLNVSRQNKITNGLNNRHLSIWASHGRYYDQNKNTWKWQRPNLFCTNEDLFTQTIVIPYLIPMLENAGAIVFSPRERDWQTHEIIVDNDDNMKLPYYQEINKDSVWQTTGMKGFKQHTGKYFDGENPFEAGSARMIGTTTNNQKLSKITYQPSIPESGHYAVYVSYQTLHNSIDDAQYTVCHKGQRTTFKVNQQMGSNTWVYLGTFDFDKGCNPYNCVILTNKSSHKTGVVTSDAVRFGGGMGNIQRGDSISGLPRALEGARYYAQWAGAPYSVYSSKNGTDDYGDDINSRPLMTNWLAGGSIFVPTTEGKKVPIELSLAIHSDAGYSTDSSVIGSLSICTTNFNDGKLNSGISRIASRDFATALLVGINRDIKEKYKSWICREIYDRNYSETRSPEMPSAILETMSHQNFNDMIYGQDPNFRFTLARSIYKTILKYISAQHGCKYIVQPLAPTNFSVEHINGNEIKLSWSEAVDSLEPTSHPTSYKIYTSTETGDFDNGHNVKKTSYIMDIDPDKQYNFRVTAVNRGGESFPSEILSSYYKRGANKTILVVNGFNRLSAPDVVNTTTEQGFRIENDPGVNYGLTVGFVGKQQYFEKSQIGINGSGGLGYTNEELAGHFFAGNDYNYVVTHTEAIASANLYNVASCSREAVETNKINLQNYDCVDIIMGLEKDDKHSLKYYKTFTPHMQKAISTYTTNHGRLIISGSYIGSDMMETNEKQFLSNILKLEYAGSEQYNPDSTITGLGLTFDIYHKLNVKHYAAIAPEILHPIQPAFCAMKYNDGNDACVAYYGNDYRCIAAGFPFECIISNSKRDSIMRGILNYIMK